MGIYGEIAKEYIENKFDEIIEDNEEEIIEWLEKRGYVVIRREDFNELELRIANEIERFLREKSPE